MVALLHPCTVLCRRSLVSRDPRLSSAPPGRNSRRSVRDLRLRPLGRLALPHIRSHGSRESADHDRHQRRGRNPARTGMATKRKPPRAWNCPRSHRCVRQRDRRITRIESLTRAVISRGAAALVPASVRTDRSARIAPIGRKALTEPIVRAAFGKAGASVRDLSEMRALRWQGNETDTQMLQFLPSRSVTEIVGGHPGIEPARNMFSELRRPRIARIRIFGSSTSISALGFPAVTPSPPEVPGKLVFAGSSRGNQGIQLLSCRTKGRQVGLGRFAARRHVEADRHTMPRDGNRGWRLQIGGEVITLPRRITKAVADLLC